MIVKNVIFPIQFLAPMIVALSINTSTRALLIKLVEEKSDKYKETQKIMGLNQVSYFVAWYFSGLIRTMLGGALFLIPPLIVSSKIDTPYYEFEFFDMTNYLGLWDLYYNNKVTQFIIIYACYIVTSINQAFAISTLFSNPKLAGEVSTFVTTLSTLLSFIVFSPDFIETPFGFIIIAMSPQACVAFAYMSCVKNPIYHDDFELVNDSLLIQYPSSTALWQMCSLVIFYGIMYFYLEAVTPNEYGVASHPLIFMNRNVKNKNKEIDVSLEDDISSAVYHQKFNNKRNSQKTVSINGLKKHFGNTKAVNGVTLQLYNKNIFCLLGHNGSGKTTTISLLTGLIEKSEGNILINGKELEDNLKAIRKQLGICQQREVLYDKLTFEEHLYFIGKIKNIPAHKLKQEVESIIELTKTQNERKKFSCELSGGNKRKLSLSMALIGGSKIVFLDEPTSGIDAISRRSIWEILEKVRNEDRTIILTTHHLDEAEVLADRIGILTSGQLLAVGDVNYIKKNFGVGYTLTLFPETQLKKQTKYFSNEQKVEITNLVQQHIPDCRINPQSNKNYLIFQIPYHSRDKFQDLFQVLEEKNLVINLELNTLEDAFINIGMGDFKMIENNIEKQDKMAQNFNGEFNQKSPSDQISGEVPAQPDFQKQLDKSTDKSTVTKIKSLGSINQDAKYTNFDNIKKPEALNRTPTFNFFAQFLACFLRKYYNTIRNFTNYVSFAVPLFLMIIVAKVLIYTPDDGPDKLVLMGIFFGVAYSFNGGIYIVQPVQEREENLKYALNVMGCRMSAFWTGTFAFDFIIYFMTVVIFILVAEGQEYTYLTDYSKQIVWTLTIFGCSFISFSYVCGYLLFSKSSSAMKGFPAVNFFLIFILPWSLLGGAYYLNYEELISWYTYQLLQRFLTLLYFIFSPLFVLYSACTNIKSSNNEGFDIPFYSYSNSQGFYNWILFAQFIIYSLLTVYLENKQYDLKPEEQLTLKKMKLHKINDKNIIQEKERVLTMEKLELFKKLQNKKDQKYNDNMQDIEAQQSLLKDKDQIIIRNLWKKYDNDYVALKDVNYGVKKGEIMGLLGPNGAGKSTSFNVLSALIPRSLGSVKIKDTQVNKGIMSIYQDVGICPQFDCVWHSLTPKEHLYIFGRMKGLRGKDLDVCVKYFLEVTQLNAFVGTKAGQLSGGNKRKLCVANALIGGPDVQFFDEPSSGVDPIARRFLWNTLKQASSVRDSAIVLTTHTMLEAESLCTKIGILINGRLQCLGSPQQLRAEYGNGYNITFEGVKDQDKELLLEQVSQHFGAAKELHENRPGFVAFQIPNTDFKFSKAYKLSGYLQKQKLIEDFQILQASLEQVFVRFSQMQQNNEQLKKK
ncbi:P-loop containing nucleoside triphosphate hydrolase [Pseudocohnilembus persalinus]|uniref:p-loop containing nucleoside triphosphate hydrolase n=1 Tax=Pseudocohnilembus persalinus TaxID=266149 RepID=A0A0V0QC72_PSEPJ|nr:P-loop containing nucleoside triphosphate hydrolase [Pseudocohnilembus persalinus]|eukprot:KRW99727.1 P-loop containing nucleoside triphosphate hydrolase [Pseudocohnilembus persalinus]